MPTSHPYAKVTATDIVIDIPEDHDLVDIPEDHDLVQLEKNRRILNPTLQYTPLVPSRQLHNACLSWGTLSHLLSSPTVP